MHAGGFWSGLAWLGCVDGWMDAMGPRARELVLLVYLSPAARCCYQREREEARVLRGPLHVPRRTIYLFCLPDFFVFFVFFFFGAPSLVGPRPFQDVLTPTLFFFPLYLAGTCLLDTCHVVRAFSFLLVTSSNSALLSYSEPAPLSLSLPPSL